MLFRSERPLKKLEEISGAFIAEGANIPALDTNKKFEVTITVAEGDRLSGGDIYATCPETPVIEHRCMVPPNVCGEVVWVAKNSWHKITDKIIELKTDDGKTVELTLVQKWPIKKSRPFRERLPISMPLVTGQRVIDTIAPIAKGGTAAVPDRKSVV